MDSVSLSNYILTLDKWLFIVSSKSIDTAYEVMTLDIQDVLRQCNLIYLNSYFKHLSKQPLIINLNLI